MEVTEHVRHREGDRLRAGLGFDPAPVTVRVQLKENRRTIANEEVKRAVAEGQGGREQPGSRNHGWRRIDLADPNFVRCKPRGTGRSFADLEHLQLPSHVVDAQFGIMLYVFLYDDRRPRNRPADQATRIHDGREHPAQPPGDRLYEMLVRRLDDQARTVQNVLGMGDISGENGPGNRDSASRN
jgi:hypothetical protein